MAETTKKRGRTKWVILAALGLVIFIAAETGWLGFGWALLRAKAFPSDEALLGYVPGDVVAVAIVDPHQIDLKAFGGASPVRSLLDRVRGDVKKVTDIDLAFDVDKMVIAPNLVVMRGRFHGDKLADRLAESRYQKSDYQGTAMLSRTGEDALAVIDDDILLYGDEASLRGAIDAQASGKSMKNEARVIDRLSSIGWNNALLATIRLGDDKPSLHEVLVGSTGPKGVTIALGTKNGLDLVAKIEAASPSAANELRALLDEQRTKVEALNGPLGTELAPVVVELAKTANLAVEPAGSSMVAIRLHLDAARFDTLTQAAAKASIPAMQAYKTMRLVQLLVP